MNHNFNFKEILSTIDSSQNTTVSEDPFVVPDSIPFGTMRMIESYQDFKDQGQEETWWDSITKEIYKS